MRNPTHVGDSHASRQVAQRPEFPEDAYREWKNAHYDKDWSCPDSSATHCAFMSGIEYAERFYGNTINAGLSDSPDRPQRNPSLEKPGLNTLRQFHNALESCLSPEPENTNAYVAKNKEQSVDIKEE